jgi:hypothetical protein
MKLTTQLTAVIITSVLGLAGLVLGLAVWASWSDGAVVAMVTIFGTIAVNLIVAIRNQQKTAETLAGQDEKLDLIEHQTNGLSAAERDDIANRAVRAVLTELDKRNGT